MKPSEKLKAIEEEIEEFMRRFGMCQSASGIPQTDVGILSYSETKWLLDRVHKLTEALESIGEPLFKEEKKSSNSWAMDMADIRELARKALEDDE